MFIKHALGRLPVSLDASAVTQSVARARLITYAIKMYYGEAE